MTRHFSANKRQIFSKNHQGSIVCYAQRFDYYRDIIKCRPLVFPITEDANIFSGITSRIKNYKRNVSQQSYPWSPNVFKLGNWSFQNVSKCVEMCRSSEGIPTCWNRVYTTSCAPVSCLGGELYAHLTVSTEYLLLVFALFVCLFGSKWWWNQSIPRTPATCEWQRERSAFNFERASTKFSKNHLDLTLTAANCEYQGF